MDRAVKSSPLIVLPPIYMCSVPTYGRCMYIGSLRSDVPSLDGAVPLCKLVNGACIPVIVVLIHTGWMCVINI